MIAAMASRRKVRRRRAARAAGKRPRSEERAPSPLQAQAEKREADLDALEDDFDWDYPIEAEPDRRPITAPMPFPPAMHVERLGRELERLATLAPIDRA